jgi:adenylate cyclase
MMNTAAPEVFRFSGYTLDVVRGCLRNAEGEIELRPKSFEVLRCLVAKAGHLVAKEELIKTVWPNVVVSDESLMQCVSEVRRAIGDSVQAIIKTVPRRGYRFTAPVVRLPPESAAGTTIEPAQFGFGKGGRLDPLQFDRPCVAVLPFVNLAGGQQQEYFSDGITEDIITELSRFSDLLVIARNSTFQYKGKSLDVRQIGRDLSARYVLEGSVRRDRGRVRIIAQLIDAETGAHCWAERYDRKLSDVFAVQEEVAREIVSILAAHVNKAEAQHALLKPPAAWKAYDYYLRGAEAFALQLAERKTELIYEARRLLEQSLAIDPGYARAYAMLARTHAYTYLEPRDGDYLSPDVLNRAHELAKKAVQLDPNLPLAHSHLGWVLLFMRQHEAAIAEFERSRSLNPNFTDPSFGLGLVFAGESARAVEVLQANLRLDPFQNPSRLGYMGHALYMLKRYTEALVPLRECVSSLPHFRIVHLWLAATYGQLGQLTEARAEAAEVLRIEPDFTIERRTRTAVYKDPKDAVHFLDGLRKAGLPER